MAQSSTDRLKFKKQDSIGVSDAADDTAFLLNCFVDTGDYDSIVDFNDPKCLVLGRTGVGKTALVTKLQEDKHDRVIVINPESLAMRHISNSTIIRYLHELDIDLNTFFKLLWRHEICVQIFVRHFKITSDSEGEKLMDKIRYQFKKKNPRHLRSLEYMEYWKDTFWKESESHVVSMISKTESEVGGIVGGSAVGLSAKLSGAKKLTEEEEYKIKQNGQTIVDSVQMKEVADLLDMLNDVIEFEQKQYYIVLDRLDESWVDDGLRYRLIKSLIETVKDLNRFDNLKPVVALRVDLLGHVFDVTQDTGFQEEKYSSLYLNIYWTKEQLIRLVDARINYLLQARYEKRKVLSHLDILPQTINGELSIDYIIDRTLMRPRDIIDFFNTFIQQAVGNTLINEEMVIAAESQYSKNRIKSLYFEWFTEYRNLKYWTEILKNKTKRIKVYDFDLETLRSMCIEYTINNQLHDVSQIDRLLSATIEVVENRLSISDFRNQLFYVFYKVGILGVVEPGNDKAHWSYERSYTFDSEDLDESSVYEFHPCFRSTLKIII